MTRRLWSLLLVLGLCHLGCPKEEEEEGGVSPEIELVCEMPRPGSIPTSTPTPQEDEHGHGTKMLVPLKGAFARCGQEGKLHVYVTIPEGRGTMHASLKLGQTKIEHRLPRGERVELGVVSLSTFEPGSHPIDLRIAEEIQELPPLTVVASKRP